MVKGKIVVKLTEREAQEILGHSASSNIKSKILSEKMFFKRLENKVRIAYQKKLRSI